MLKYAHLSTIILYCVNPKVQGVETMFVRRFIQRLQLEIMVSQYIASCEGPVLNREARQQARALIMNGPYNPMNTGSK